MVRSTINDDEDEDDDDDKDDDDDDDLHLLLLQSLQRCDMCRAFLRHTVHRVQ